jgi:hypothetical protein
VTATRATRAREASLNMAKKSEGWRERSGWREGEKEKEKETENADGDVVSRPLAYIRCGHRLTPLLRRCDQPSQRPPRSSSGLTSDDDPTRSHVYVRCKIHPSPSHPAPQPATPRTRSAPPTLSTQTRSMTQQPPTLPTLPGWRTSPSASAISRGERPNSPKKPIT